MKRDIALFVVLMGAAVFIWFTWPIHSQAPPPPVLDDLGQALVNHKFDPVVAKMTADLIELTMANAVAIQAATTASLADKDRRIAALETTVAAQQAQLGTLQSRVTALEAQTSALTARVAAVETRVNCILLPDSWTSTPPPPC